MVKHMLQIFYNFLDKKKALKIACKRGHVDIVSLLFKNGVKADSKYCLELYKQSVMDNKTELTKLFIFNGLTTCNYPEVLFTYI